MQVDKEHLAVIETTNCIPALFHWKRFTDSVLLLKKYGVHVTHPIHVALKPERRFLVVMATGDVGAPLGLAVL